ncbi:MCE family protein [Streptomyces sp. NBC_00083]|uniref:MCE family protein n=1 Tax=Streptomyces sp. NBC_00083 TaxID=2975647 RepID=UPI00224DC183|nr:MCE family protein [Streptomyces sp. NBC_00083]MCX5386705.1 MCE family protein [Streptomyces sp. NBC_00083]
MNAPTARRRLAGVVFLLVPALLIWLSIAVYDKDFTRSDTVTVLTGSVGNEMHRGAEVKLRGVVVGEVRGISADGRGARLTLALQPGRLGHIPSDVRAQMLPTTLFGERFVALVPPPNPSTRALSADATIPQDRSSNAIELEQVLDHVLPMLTAVKPDKLSATLSAVATALRGRGSQLGDTVVTLDAHLKKFNPNLPALNADLVQLVKVTQTYSDAAPDILRALTDATTTTGTLVDQQTQLLGVYGQTTRTAQDLTAFLQQNKDNIIRLSDVSRPTLELLARYAPSFPCTLRTLTGFVPAMDKALGKGTDQPGLHVTVKAVPSLGAYVPGRDTPAYTDGGGPHCYPVPYLGAPLPTESAPTTTATASGAGLGLPNSPQENQLVNELLAPSLKEAPQSLPDWSSLLVGPALRGTEVTIK